MTPWATIAKQVIGTGIAVGQSVINRRAQKQALERQRAAIEQLDTITTDEANTLVKQGDIDFYNDSMAEFRKRNPGLDKARDATEKTIQDMAEGDPLKAARDLLDQQINEVRDVDPQTAAIRQELLRQTNRDLKLGATLPPEYQAEMIKAGLENSRVVGTGGNRLGDVTQRLGNRIGSAGLALQQQRQGQAATALALDDALTKGRQAILGNLVNQSATIPTAELAMADRLRGIAGSEIPSIGLRGTDLLGVEQARVQAENQRKLALAGIDAQWAMGRGAMKSGILGAFKPVDSGGGGGGGGGGMGGMFSMFGGGGGGGGGGAGIDPGGEMAM